MPAAQRTGHKVALGVDWGLSTLLSAGAARVNSDGTITAFGSGAQYRAAWVLAKQHRLRRQGEQLHAKASHYDRLIAGNQQHPLIAKAGRPRRGNPPRGRSPAGPRSDAGPPHAVVFATKPIAFAVRDVIAGTDLDAIAQPGQGMALWLHAPDAQDIHDALAAAGTTIISSPADGPFGRTFTFADPDGYQVTLHDRG